MIHFVTHEFAPFRGGIATYVRETARAAADLGFPVRVIVPDYGIARHPADASENFPVERVRCSGRLTPAGIWSLARALAGRREALCDSKIVLLSPGALMAMMLARELKWIPSTGPIFSFFHGSEVLRFQRHLLWRRLAARFLPHTTPACASQFVAELIHQKGLIPRDISILRAPCACPVDVAGDANKRRDISNLTAKSSDEFVLLTLARIHPRKGLHLTAQALGMLPQELKRRVHYVIAGEGSGAYREKVERACATAGIRHTLRDVASPDQLSSIYAACDVFIMTSVQLPESVEGFGISYLEASVHEKPIVAFRSGGVAEAVVHEKTGLLVDEGDLDGVAAAVERLMRDPQLCADLGRGGRAYAATFSWDDAARALCQA